MPITNYRIGLVLSGAGLNDAQLLETKARLKQIVRAMSHPNEGITLIVPCVHNVGPAAALATEEMLEAFAPLSFVHIEVAESVHEATQCVSLFESCDEVWCCPRERESFKRSRAFIIYQMRSRDTRPTKYKIIPPWVETAVPEAKTRQPQQRQKGSS